MKVKELPEGWELRKVGDVIENIPLTGKKLPNSEYDEEGIIPVVDQGQNLIGGYTNRENLKITTGFPLIGFGDHTRILKFIDFEFVPGADGIKILKPSKEFDPKFFYYTVKSSNILDLGYSRHFKVLKELVIPLPPLPVQRQIVAVLEQAEALKRQRQEADTLTGALLQSVFYEMFGDPVRNEKGWNSTKLGDIITITSGHGFKFDEYTEDGIKLLRINNVTFGKIIWEQIAFLPKTYPQEYPDLVLKEGDILIALNRPILGDQLKIGIMQKNDSPAILYQRVGRINIRDKQKSNPLFLYHLMRTPFFLNELSAKLSGSDQPYINPTEMVKIILPLPPLALQQQFAHIVEDVERVRERQVESGKEIEALCGGLMQQAFAGELVG